MAKPVEQLESVVIRFAGDSGDGMQLTGGRFTSETAMAGNDLATFPDFPAEIRAPGPTVDGLMLSTRPTPTASTARAVTPPGELNRSGEASPSDATRRTSRRR
jgi:hypothetical protein